MKQNSHQRDRMSAFLLVATLAAFWWRGIDYSRIDSLLPLIFIGSICGLLGLSYLMGKQMLRWMIRIWAILMILYAIARMAMGTLLQLVDIGSMHATESTGPIYFIFSGLYLLAGIFLLIRIRKFIS